MEARGRSYSDSHFGGLQFLHYDTISVAGTNAAITALADTQRRFMAPVKFLGTAGVWIKTGGTAAGPSVLLQYSTAGTGTWTSFGTWASGTDADGTADSFVVTETTLAAGDVVRLAIAAGTAAATPVVEVTIPFVEAFVGL